jgi:predicted dehydrogenase
VDPVRIGILGAARIAPAAVIAPARAIPEAEVVAVAARDPERAEAFAREHGIPRTHPDYDALLADPDVDAVYNPLPNGLHGVWTIAALEAGKHVLCEKPLTANAAEAETVAAAAERADRVVMEAFHYRYHPLMARVLDLCGQLGTIRRLSARMIAVLPNRRDIRYRLDLAGGATMDVGCYALHELRTIAGAEPTVLDATPTTISPGVDRAMRARMSFADGSTATMECALLAARPPVADLRVTGEHGSVTVYFPTRPQLGWISARIGGTTRRERVKGEATFFYQLRAFCDAAQNGAAVLTPPADAVANMRVIDAVYEASGRGARNPSAAA